jgi:hypothetical protein
VKGKYENQILWLRCGLNIPMIHCDKRLSPQGGTFGRDGTLGCGALWEDLMPFKTRDVFCSTFLVVHV